MATILAHIRVHEGAEERFEGLARSLVTDTEAVEPHCRRYEYWRAAEPRLYYCLLAFDDFHGFLEHQTSDHHESASPKLGELIEDIRLEWVDPIQGASPLPSTNMQDVPEGASELTRTYHKIFAARIQDWWLKQRS